jgi:hypothetical protein
MVESFFIIPDYMKHTKFTVIICPKVKQKAQLDQYMER